MAIRKRIVITTFDIIMAPIAWYLAFWLRFNLESIPGPEHLHVIQTLWLVTLSQLAAYITNGTYRSIWRFASLHDLLKIVKTTAFGSVLILLSLFLTENLNHVPRSIIPAYFLLLTTILCSSRIIIRVCLERLALKINKTNKQRILIVGAGSAGANLARDMLSHSQHAWQPVAFLDDDSKKQGCEIHGIRIVGTTNDIIKTVSEHQITQIVLAMATAKSSELSRILKLCEPTGLTISTLPSLDQLVNGQVSIDSLRAISLEDLLGRDPISLDWSAIKNSITNKIILVTGAGGSIGTEVCQQLAQLKPSLLIAVDHAEFNLFSLQQELELNFSTLKVVYHLISIQDKVALNQTLQTHQPEMIFHAAAYKHVPLLENEIREAIYNNVLGTYNLALAAINAQVKKFIMVSTDKAVNPRNIMGASKRIAEIICQSLNQQQNITKFITVRFGNVLGSAGSVVPIFRKQIERGGPVTVTHPEITRFFMTIQEAAQLILQAQTIGKGGEIFILDMGTPIKITLLAEQMIKLSGKKPGEDIKIKYTGLRPGEKLYEELFHKDESLIATSNRKIMLANSREYSWKKLLISIEMLATCCHTYDIAKLIALIKELVPEHHFDQQEQTICQN